MSNLYRPCHRCERQVRIIVKMGGLICENCRVIIAQPFSDEWREAWQEIEYRKHLIDELDDYNDE